jgi:hypothetical protein
MGRAHRQPPERTKTMADTKQAPSIEDVTTRGLLRLSIERLDDTGEE